MGVSGFAISLHHGVHFLQAVLQSVDQIGLVCGRRLRLAAKFASLSRHCLGFLPAAIPTNLLPINVSEPILVLESAGSLRNVCFVSTRRIHEDRPLHIQLPRN